MPAITYAMRATASRSTPCSPKYVESVLPGAGWWATIYGRFLGATYDEDMWVRALAELGAEFTLFYDSLAPQKPGACERVHLSTFSHQ